MAAFFNSPILLVLAVIAPLLVFAILKPLLKWDDQRRAKERVIEPTLQGFELKTTTGPSPVLQEERDKDHG